MKKLLLLVLCGLTLSAVIPVAASAAVSPDDIKGWLALSALPVMWVLGIIYTRVPALKKFTNDATPWVNLVAFVFATYLVPVASVGMFDGVAGFGGLLWRTAVGAATSATASLLYDKFLKAVVDRAIPFPR